jgi:hypothetical protein
MISDFPAIWYRWGAFPDSFDFPVSGGVAENNYFFW